MKASHLVAHGRHEEAHPELLEVGVDPGRDQHQQRRAKAARLLGISERNLYRKVRGYGLG